MITTLKLNNFRGISEVDFDNLGRVNLVVGGNNTGKTSVLEALSLLYGSPSQLKKLPGTFRQNNDQNSDQWNRFWPLLVGNEEISKLKITSDDFEITGKNDGQESHFLFSKIQEPSKKTRAVRMIGPNKGSIEKITLPVHVSILSTQQPDASLTSKIFNEIAPLNPQNEDRLQDLLRNSLEPRLRRLRYAKPQGAQEHLVYVDLGNGPMVPFTQMGQAFVRALHIYCEIFALQPDILLVDEIENGLYYGGLKDFWKGLIAVLEDQNVQLFATTHSRECMEAACEANKDGKTTLRYLRLDRKAKDPDTIVGTVFDDSTMASAIKFGEEMR